MTSNMRKLRWPEGLSSRGDSGCCPARPLHASPGQAGHVLCSRSLPQKPRSGHTGLAAVKALQTLAAATLLAPGATAPNCPAPSFCISKLSLPKPSAQPSWEESAGYSLHLSPQRRACGPPTELPATADPLGLLPGPGTVPEHVPTSDCLTCLPFENEGTRQPAASTTSSSSALALSRETQAPPAAPRAVQALREPFISFLTRGCTRGFMYWGGGQLDRGSQQPGQCTRGSRAGWRWDPAKPSAWLHPGPLPTQHADRGHLSHGPGHQEVTEPHRKTWAHRREEKRGQTCAHPYGKQRGGGVGQPHLHSGPDSRMRDPKARTGPHPVTRGSSPLPALLLGVGGSRTLELGRPQESLVHTRVDMFLCTSSMITFVLFFSLN